jgi:hypothetical protein
MLRTLRKLVLGETWALPGGIAVAVVVAVAVRAGSGAGAWWHHGGGFVLLALLVVGFVVALRFPR